MSLSKFEFTEDRKTWVANKPSSAVRVMTYNVLAECYTNKGSSKERYSFCSNYLSAKERFPHLLVEVNHSKPDILCLQEVEPLAFTSVFNPVLKKKNI